MKIRIIRNFGNYKAGKVFDWPEGMARVFVARGMVEEVMPEVPAEPEPETEPAVETETSVEEARVQPRVERAEVDHRNRKHRR